MCTSSTPGARGHQTRSEECPSRQAAKTTRGEPRPPARCAGERLAQHDARSLRASMSNTPNPVPPVRPAPTGPPQPDRPVVPPDDPGSPDVMREPNVDPPPTDPPVETPSDKPMQPPPTPHAREAAPGERGQQSTRTARRQLRLVRPRRRRRRAPTCEVGEITVTWRGIQVLQSSDCDKPWRTRR